VPPAVRARPVPPARDWNIAGEWRKLSRSAKLIVDPERGARCAIRDTGAAGADRYDWPVTLFGEPDPVAAGLAGELAEARTLAEEALAALFDG
jgi:hypothetical protein